MLWVVALLAVTGCVSKRVVPDAVNGKRILLPTPVALSPPVVVTFVDGVAAIPLVGWFKVARDSKQAKAVGAMLSATGLDVPTEFAAALHSELSAQGVTAIAALPVLRKPLRRTSVWPKESDLPTREATECFVDVSLVYGFSATTNGVNYEPYMVANVKVSNALTHRVSLRRTIGYNFSAGMHVTVEPLAGLPTWEDGPAIEADIAGARDAFRTIMREISSSAAKYLTANDLLRC